MLGDPIEFEALAATYGHGEAPCALGSVKTNLGHLRPPRESPVSSRPYSSLGHDSIPPNLHFNRWNRAIDPTSTRFFVPTETSPWPTDSGPLKPRRAAVSSFGLGGTNAHVVLEQAPAQVGPRAPLGCATVSTLVVSGKSPERTAAWAATLADWMADTGSGVPLADVAYTLTHHRPRYAKAAMVCARDRAQALVGLRALAAGRPADGVVAQVDGASGRARCSCTRVRVRSGWGWAGNYLPMSLRLRPL